MHQALYRKWRPQTFSDVYGQEHITSILEYETENNKFSHAYLFCGSRGTGKTTCAKILAKAVNCESPVNGNPCNECPSCRSIDAGIATDVLEMDAASNNGVDNVRDIRDEVVYSPSALKYRVYIVDEVHMLTGSAFNALLKTLEEPPAHAIFILATTELHKLPSTIVSRCQRYDFRRISTDTLIERLEYISQREGFEYTREALRVIAKMAQGGMRDAISLLELCASSHEKITVELVNTTLGVGGRESIERIVKAIADNDFETIFATIDTVISSAKDIGVFWQDLADYYRDMLVIKTTASAKKYLDLTDDECERLLESAALFSKESLLYHCRILDDTFFVMQKNGVAKRTVAEMSLIKMCDSSLECSFDSLMARISRLEGIIASGNIPAAATQAAAPQKVEAEPVSAPENKPEEKSEPVKPAKKPNTDLPAALKSLRGWNEIIEKMPASEASVLGFLKQAKALVDTNGKIYVRFGNDFAKGMADKPKTKDALRGAMSLVLNRAVSPDDVIFGIVEGNEDALDELDEFNID